MIKRFWMRLSLNQKIVLPFLAVSLSILLSGVLALGYWFTEGLEQNLRREVASFAERVQQDLTHEWQDLNDQLKLIATQANLQTALERHDQIALLQILLPLKASLGFDWVKVVDTEGLVLLDARVDALNQAELADTAISNSASAGGNLTDLVRAETVHQQVHSQQMLLAANHPIKSERLVGGLIIGRLVDDDLLRKIAAGSSKQLIALVNDRVIAKTLPQLQEAMLMPGSVNDPAIRIPVGNQHYLTKTLVLKGSKFVLTLLVLYPITPLEMAKAMLWLRLGLLLGLSGTIITSIGVCIARAIARPIRTLTRMTQQLAAGDTTVRVPTIGNDEIGQLGKAFNQMADQLAERGLLNQQIQHLQQTLGDLQRNQAQLIHAEKMSSLGQLVAGVAHEINTPLGAIQSSIGNITSALDQALTELPPLLRTLPSDQLAHFFMLLGWARQPAMLSSREERQLKRSIQQTLTVQGLPHADMLANTLSKMGVATALDPILSLLQAPDAPTILETAYQLSIVQNNSQNIQLAVDRAARIVYALKNYVRHDVLGAPIYASVTDGIETVLTLYQNHLKRGIDVEKHYASLPAILCYPEELSQVWSNLVSNAIQAMNYQGRLAIATSAHSQHILVQFTDTGNGISPDIRDRIFEPFFTTKALGEGTGLGLSIVKNIIDKHQGHIEVESVPGQTVFKVWLPLPNVV